MKASYQRFRRFAAFLVGVTFLVSGLLKVADPTGTMLILQEYFRFFQVPALNPAARVLGVLLALFETSLGIALITGVLRKAAALCTYALLAFFTVITLVLWILNPSMDCGCFGEALHLTHAQSFWKNVVLMVLSVVAFTPFHDFGKARGDRIVAAAVAFLGVLLALYYSNTHLPIADFTEYDWGVELYASLDEDVTSSPEYKAAYIYEKDGEQSSFTLDQLPDSTWTFVGVDTVFRAAGAQLTDYPVLSFRDAEGEYQDRLAAKGCTVVFSVYDPSRLKWDTLREQYEAVLAAGGTPLVLVSALPEEVPGDIPTYFADYKTLITLNRSNGGGTFFNEGELVNKWDQGHFPEDLAADFAADPVDLSTHYIVRRRLRMQGFCVALAGVLLLL